MKISVGEVGVLPLARSWFLRIERVGHTAPSAAGITLGPFTDRHRFSSHCPARSRYLCDPVFLVIRNLLEDPIPEFAPCTCPGTNHPRCVEHNSGFLNVPLAGSAFFAHTSPPSMPMKNPREAGPAWGLSGVNNCQPWQLGYRLGCRAQPFKGKALQMA